MKKVIKLTESDLTNIVKRVIKENAAKDSLFNTLKNEGLHSAAGLVGGVDNLMKILEVKTPEDYLDLFKNLTPEGYERNPNYYFLVDDNGVKIFNIKTYPSGHIRVTFNGHIISTMFQYGFNLNHSKFIKLIHKWFEDNYGIVADEFESTGGWR
jgi:hypothetical protein